jgi:predicted HTH transcriptional regulator
MILQADLMGLLASPNESLTIEYKSWLPLSEKQSCAALAKAAIALANQGGGLVVLGMRENKAEESTIRSQPRPESVGIYRQDDVNAAINRYADPPLHCELLFAKHPETAIEHAFIYKGAWWA